MYISQWESVLKLQCLNCFPFRFPDHEIQCPQLGPVYRTWVCYRTFWWIEVRFWSVIESLCRTWSVFGPVSQIIGPVLVCYSSITTTFKLPCSIQLKPKPTWFQYHQQLAHLYHHMIWSTTTRESRWQTQSTLPWWGPVLVCYWSHKVRYWDMIGPVLVCYSP